MAGESDRRRRVLLVGSSAFLALVLLMALAALLMTWANQEGSHGYFSEASKLRASEQLTLYAAERFHDSLAELASTERLELRYCGVLVSDGTGIRTRNSYDEPTWALTRKRATLTDENEVVYSNEFWIIVRLGELTDGSDEIEVDGVRFSLHVSTGDNETKPELESVALAAADRIRKKLVSNR